MKQMHGLSTAAGLCAGAAAQECTTGTAVACPRSPLRELCNRSDVLTDAGCLARFRQVSSATRTCRNATATYSRETGTCTIAAECLWGDPKVVLFPYMPTGIVIPFLELDEVHNCGGLLRRGPCNSAPQGRTTVSVSDARVGEAQGASLEFAITLSRVHPKSLTIGYSTRDGTARAGADYGRTAGILTFWSGQTRKTVAVPVLDDELAEGPETLKLKVWIARGWPVHLANPVATGTIVNTDRMPKAWIARFGRTVADQVLDALDARMRATPAPGAEARLAGQRIDLAPLFGARSGGDALSGTPGRGKRTPAASRAKAVRRGPDRPTPAMPCWRAPRSR